MAPRLAVLIAAAWLLAGCVKPRNAAEARAECGACHEAHYAEQGACAECHRGEPKALRKELAHARLLTGRAAAHPLAGGEAVREGRRLVEAAACRRCHAIGGEGNALATNLDAVVWEREQQQLGASISEPVAYMPSFGFDARQAEAVIAYLLSRRLAGGTSGAAYRVHFDRDARQAQSAFAEKCGGCHRLLSPLGPEGARNAGPNLSGLFTRFHPATAPGDRAWSEALLADWVRNPRALRPNAGMPPVSLADDEWQRVVELLRARAP